MVDRTGLCLIDRFIRIGSVVSILLGKSNEFIASKICGKLLFLVLSPFSPLKLIVIFKNQAWMYLESNGRKTRPIERRSIPLADRKESFRIIFSTISIEKITRKHFYHIFSKFIHTEVVYFLFFIYVRELFVKYNFVKLFLTKSIENYLTNIDKLFLISAIDNPWKITLRFELTIISYNSCTIDRVSNTFSFFPFVTENLTERIKDRAHFPRIILPTVFYMDYESIHRCLRNYSFGNKKRV